MKDILVHMDGGERNAARLKVAVDLAKLHGARLVGLFSRVDTDLVAVQARRASDRLTAHAEESSLLFHAAVEAAGLTHSWFQLAHGEESFVVGETSFSARYADLVVLGQWEPEHGHVPGEFVEQVVLQSGRPVLVIPYAIDVASIATRVAIAWNASREATRALHDAMPFLTRATEVRVMAVHDSSESIPTPDVPHVGVVGHLAAHGVQTRVDHLFEDDIGIMDALLSRTFDMGADLLVMGAHSGIGRLRGSGTRFILRHMTLPVLISN